MPRAKKSRWNFFQRPRGRKRLPALEMAFGSRENAGAKLPKNPDKQTGTNKTETRKAHA